MPSWPLQAGVQQCSVSSNDFSATANNSSLLQVAEGRKATYLALTKDMHISFAGLHTGQIANYTDTSKVAAYKVRCHVDSRLARSGPGQETHAAPKCISMSPASKVH